MKELFFIIFFFFLSRQCRVCIQTICSVCKKKTAENRTLMLAHPRAFKLMLKMFMWASHLHSFTYTLWHKQKNTPHQMKFVRVLKSRLHTQYSIEWNAKQQQQHQQHSMCKMMKKKTLGKPKRYKMTYESNHKIFYLDLKCMHEEMGYGICLNEYIYILTAALSTPARFPFRNGSMSNIHSILSSRVCDADFFPSECFVFALQLYSLTVRDLDGLMQSTNRNYVTSKSSHTPHTHSMVLILILFN